MKPFIFFLLSAVAAEDLAVLPSAPGADVPGAMLETWLKQQAYAAFDRRHEAFEKLKSQAECRAWQEERRAFFLKQIGGLSERTPLNAKTVGTLKGAGYRVENILFESRPGFHVTANLYLPESPPPWPAVLVPCGHSHDGKAAGVISASAFCWRGMAWPRCATIPSGRASVTRCSISKVGTRTSMARRMCRCRIRTSTSSARSSTRRWDWAASCSARTSRNTAYGTG